jgi:hypothetical protein
MTLIELHRRFERELAIRYSHGKRAVWPAFFADFLGLDGGHVLQFLESYQSETGGLKKYLFYSCENCGMRHDSAELNVRKGIGAITCSQCDCHSEVNIDEIGIEYVLNEEHAAILCSAFGIDVFQKKDLRGDLEDRPADRLMTVGESPQENKIKTLTADQSVINNITADTVYFMASNAQGATMEHNEKNQKLVISGTVGGSVGQTMGAPVAEKGVGAIKIAIITGAVTIIVTLITVVGSYLVKNKNENSAPVSQGSAPVKSP